MASTSITSKTSNIVANVAKVFDVATIVSTETANTMLENLSKLTNASDLKLCEILSYIKASDIWQSEKDAKGHKFSGFIEYASAKLNTGLKKSQISAYAACGDLLAVSYEIFAPFGTTKLALLATAVNKTSIDFIVNAITSGKLSASMSKSTLQKALKDILPKEVETTEPEPETETEPEPETETETSNDINIEVSDNGQTTTYKVENLIAVCVSDDILTKDNASKINSFIKTFLATVSK